MTNILLCDTTLRDGEQTPGVVFSPEQKIELATRFSDFGINVIELMPSVSPQEEEVMRALVENGLAATMTASTMVREQDVERAASCGAQNITLFTPVSDMHIHRKLGMTRDENLRRSEEMVAYARSYGMAVNFAGEDATRADRGYMREFLELLKEDIGYFLVCDTLGCLRPTETIELFQELSAVGVPLGSHAHNDFGMGTANTLAAYEGGAQVLSGTFTGIGERAGNAPMEEVLAGLRYLYGKDLPVTYSALMELCQLVEQYSRVALQRHKPIVGGHAFAHESGIHADGVIKHPPLYENFPPEDVGQERKIIFGKHSGANALRYALEDVGDDDVYALLDVIKDRSQRERRAYTIDEVRRMHEYLGAVTHG